MFLINSFIYSSAPPVETEFKITVDTTQPGSASDTFVLPLRSGATSMTVYWGDGNSDVITTYNQAELTHVYASSGTYQISCDGSFTGVAFAGGGDRLKLSSIDNWGTNTWSLTYQSFLNCSNMVGTYTDNPDFSDSTSMLQTFYGCTNFNSPLDIDTSSVTTMYQMFFGCINFNSDITFSDTSSVTDMRDVFRGCTAFNKSISLDLSSVTSQFSFTFRDCISLNSPITFTNTSGVTIFYGVFRGCTIFDQDLSGFNITSLTNAGELLLGTAFSTTNYDLLLVGWQGQTHNNSVAFHAGTAQYSSGAPATARASLVTDLWTITDGGLV